MTGGGPLPESFAGLAASADRQALVPMTAGYLILMAALAFGLWRMYRPGRSAASRRALAEQPDRPQAVPSRSGWAALARRVVGTAVGGYLLLMATVVAYYYAVTRVGGNFLESAATGSALLIGLTAPVFAAASWLTERPWRHRDRSADTDRGRR